MTLILFLFVVSYSISTSNHNLRMCFLTKPKVVSYSISTSNHNTVMRSLVASLVVSYSISTSNHNCRFALISASSVVSYSISTSNHNLSSGTITGKWLYLIPFLHQTTTFVIIILCFFSCILFHFYIKPQPSDCEYRPIVSCILFHFYIKPQLARCPQEHLQVVSYSISTSNHNWATLLPLLFLLYLIPFLHQTTTMDDVSAKTICCILFHFYIKPQPIRFISFLA